MVSKNSPWLESVCDEKRFPSLQESVSCDVCVIGAGVAGVIAAYRLSQQGLSVVLLEKDHVATGDTAYTTGFVTRVPDAMAAALKEEYGEAFLQKLFTATLAAQAHLRALVSQHAIDCDWVDCSSYYCSYHEGDEELSSEWSAISSAAANAFFSQQASAACPPAREAIVFSGEARFNVRKFLFALLAKTGARVFEESEATSASFSPQGVEITTAAGRVSARKCIVTTGVPVPGLQELSSLFKTVITFASAMRFEKPPFSDDLFWDTNNPYYYYRRLDERTIIVGGCDRAAGEKPVVKPHEQLKKFVSETFGSSFEVTNEWSGALLETADGLPYSSALENNDKVIVATGFGGNGLVLGCLAAMVAADLAAGKQNEHAELLSFARTRN